MLSNKDWLKLIDEKEKEIIEIGISAYREARENPHLRFIVEMHEDGEVYHWYDIAGGNSFHSSVFNGTAIELFEFCFQYCDFEISDDQIREAMITKGYEDIIKEVEEYAADYGTSMEVAIRDEFNHLSDVVDYCVKAEIEFDIENYAEETVKNILEQKKDAFKTLSADLLVIMTC